MEKPSLKFSVVTASFNQAKFLRQCMESVLSQQGVDLEYIVIDGGSTDGSQAIIQQYKDRLKFWSSRRDLGCADALNRGLDYCTGDVFYYLNSDDYLLPSALERAKSFILKHPNSDIIYGHGYTADETGNVIYPTYSSRWSARGYAAGRVSIFQQATFLRRKPDIRFNTENRTCWDGELLVDQHIRGRSFLRMPFSYKLAVFRLHRNSITGSQASVREHKRNRLALARKLGLENASFFPYFVWELATDSTLLLRRMMRRRVKFTK